MNELVCEAPPLVIPDGFIAPDASQGFAAPGLNFPGPGWNGPFRQRPRNIVDLAAKIHDLTYHLNGLRFFEHRPALNSIIEARPMWLLRARISDILGGPPLGSAVGDEIRRMPETLRDILRETRADLPENARKRIACIARADYIFDQLMEVARERDEMRANPAFVDTVAGRVFLNRREDLRA